MPSLVTCGTVTMFSSFFYCYLHLFVGVFGLQLPPPTGPYNVGTTPYVLKHTTVNDPVAPSNISDSILLNIYYPTHDHFSPQKYLWGGLTALYDAYFGLPNGTFNDITADLAYNARPISVKEHINLRLPTLIFGPAMGGPPSQLYTGLILELVSRGFPVVTVDHPWEAPYIEYPNGTEFTGHAVDWSPCYSIGEAIHTYRLLDNSAVLDALPQISDQLNIPLDFNRFAFFGHSLGGSAALGQTLVEKQRPSSQKKVFLGAINIDGSLNGVTAANSSWVDTHAPSLILGSAKHGFDPTWAVFESFQSSWVKSLRILGNSNHTDYSDLIFLKQANNITGGEDVILAKRFLQIYRTMVGDFFEMLVGKGEGILNGSGTVQDKFPEVAFDYNGTGNPCTPAEICWLQERAPNSC